MKNKIVDMLMSEHERCLQDLKPIEATLKKIKEEETWREMGNIVKIVEKYNPHFTKESNVLFPELDKMNFGNPIVKDIYPLVKFEHGDWKMISIVANRQISSAIRRRDEKMKPLAALLTSHAITFLKNHFSLEENVVFPLIPKLDDRIQDKVLFKMKFMPVGRQT